MIGIIERWSRGEATTEEVERLTAWRSESPANERYCQEMLRLLEAARMLDRGDEPARVPTAAELLAGARSSPAANQHPDARRFGSAAGWGQLPWGIAAAALIALTVALTRQGPDQVLGTAAPLEVSTSAMELATVRLADGSVVRLGPSTRLRVDPDPATREVSLSGRAFFAVASDPSRPFSVRTVHGVARVLGTSFELKSDESDLQLTVVEGRVELSAGERGVEVGRGERSGIAAGQVQEPVAIDDADEVLRWIGTFLVFQSTPLAAAVREVERAYDLRVSIVDAEVATRTVTATFMNQSAEEVLEVLCSVVDARCHFEPEGIVISR